MSKKLIAGDDFPVLTLNKLDGTTINWPPKGAAGRWQMLVVYRGKHCPICTQYLSKLNDLLMDFNALGIDLTVVSADSREKTESHLQAMKPDFDIAYDLTVEQMRTLGLYISHPRSAAETDKDFAEPGMFLVNEQKQLQLIDISNAPFARPELQSIIMGLGFIRNPENNYPIRGTAI